jgi:hypothetical protein
MPSAPITTSAVAVLPSANTAVALPSSWRKPVHRCPVRTVPGGSCPASDPSRSGQVAVNGIDRWIGGVHLQGHHVPWRWDDGTETIIRRPGIREP